ncbi:hypothetical protein MDOR_38940 [Mycolicibacterium doricum]|uniref:Serine/threonine protein kinase n=1 Tax=Mycolicibacterium doricum TaxID=126673 RepID=A0A1X1T8J5_9MYCO|nr:hypothetical protein [Mycolicibacterium doricum]MCV7267413.1 hypothetical protein [Mycolicibacterium doricum]ORV40877.1 hypothetical protein AWC01_10440 [Mycolicibacterium doricum]BBZ09725.1 hypothetical protein MDOR_38940 [Mycolicibacterium doricum]
MTWPPPPPSSDPWATGPVPGRDDGESAAEPALEPLWEPVSEPVADSGPDEFSEPVEQPIDQPVDRPIDQPVADGGSPSAGYGTPPPVVPRAQMAPRQPKRPVWLIAAAVLGVILVGVAVWLLVPSGEGGGTITASTTSPTRTADPRAEADLRGLIPRGYAPDACDMQPPPERALAKASCGANTDPGGPPSATYTITADDTALDAAFNDVVEATSIVTCPGNIQSPGPWRRNATPQKVSGVLFCGLQADGPVVAWTNSEESLIAVVKSGPQGPALEQLYIWWSSHS